MVGAQGARAGPGLGDGCAWRRCMAVACLGELWVAPGGGAGEPPRKRTRYTFESAVRLKRKRLLRELQ